ncbi:right-handed parallel beta-helix repeat-containing protein [Allorhizobium taibaishanense]|uniref:Right handed beta helix domain-containing protein n=2 Tax=Allorhizobium taibaishanense TaxID=887144 RepID=A0A7W6MVU7_9HYPH|nr:right-handed parallel beta-helix repeat-containing protein [Allorhizobium taibaishanense]MBB4009559.1 hypothetical protein [Allorhizobium taibaishanense]
MDIIRKPTRQSSRPGKVSASAWPLLAVLPLLVAMPVEAQTGASTAPPPGHGAVAKPCASSVYDDLRNAPIEADSVLRIACKVELKHDDLVMQNLELSGAEASGVSIDCHGGVIGLPGQVPKGAPPTIRIASLRKEDGSWSVPRDIVIRNCKIYGSIHIMGLGANGEAELVRQSSLNRNHTEYAQSAAPSGVVLDNLTIVADGPIPLYVAPGVTHVTLSHSVIQGQTKGSAIYLDAESAYNTISGDRFELGTRSREMIAVDGSAHNVIEANSFLNAVHGGIFLYRNCGEGGTIRHQTPQHNKIAGNSFVYEDAVRPRPAIWLNAREAWRNLYCYQDPPAPFGSGADNRSFADFNTVTGNRITGGDIDLIRDKGDNNVLSDNSAKPH